MKNLILITNIVNQIITVVVVYSLITMIVGAIITLIVVKVNIKRKCKRIVLEESVLLKELNQINLKYKFYNVKSMYFRHTYDNENFYNDISCEDFLIYELSTKKDSVQKSIYYTQLNKVFYKRYTDEIEKLSFKKRNYDEHPKFLRNEILKYEKELFEKAIKKPTIAFYIHVTLIKTNINGRFMNKKSETFLSEAIEDYIYDLNDRNGYYYNNKNIWDAICRVERGKVSNKMRFSIYERDGYKCRICGSKKNLEIDHIVPIARGGKSIYSNLQTLCQRCNKRKGAN